MKCSHKGFNPQMERLWKMSMTRPDDKCADAFFSKGCELERRLIKTEEVLRASLELQSFYASLLNQYDGGKRLGFKTPKQWISRLIKIGKIKS